MKSISYFLKNNVQNINFWILIFFIVRCYGIYYPPLEVSHNWRQTTVTMVARNFFEIDSNLLFPRLDIAGDKTGITGMEFPLLNYLIHLISLIFGYEHWYGRLINLITSSLGILFFYKLLLSFFKNKTALYSSLILMCSLWFSFSRKIMPDTFSLSLIIGSLYYLSQYFTVKNREFKNIMMFFILATFGILSKITSGYLLVLVSLFILTPHYSLTKKYNVIGFGILALIPSVFWYFYWVPHLLNTYEFEHFFMGNSMFQGLNELIKHLPLTLKQFYDVPIKFIGFGLFVGGIIYSIKSKNKLIISITSLTFVTFFIIMLKAGYGFSRHNYYILPFIPTMALVCGYLLSNIKKTSIAIVLLIFVMIENLANQTHDFILKPKFKAIAQLENDLDIISNSSDLIAINSGYNPTPMYFSHRKGWVLPNDKLKDPNKIEILKAKGLKYIVILKQNFGTDLQLNYNLVFDNDHYRIYKLK